MKLSILAAFLSSLSLSIACAGTGPCHDGPYNPALEMQRTNTQRPNKNSNPWPGSGPSFSYGGTPGGAPLGAFVGGGGKQSGAGGKSNTPPILPRGLNSYEHSVHNARDAVLKAREAIAEAHEAVLQARSFYDYDDSLYARDAEFDDGTLYARDAYGYNFYEEYVPRSLSSGSGGVGGPQLPSGVDPNGLHLFTRLNTVPKAYPPFGSVNHAGLNKLMADLGGQHVDVIHGNPDKGYIECGLTLVDMAWTKTHSNADGYPVYARCVPVVHGERDLYTYMGEYEGGSVTSLSQALLTGRAYDHRNYHCGTFVEQLLQIMGFR